MGRDSDLTVNFDDSATGKGGALSKAKLDQLAAAREKALLARRKKLQGKLESKLAELRHVLGCDMRNDTVEKFATAMMKQEETLRKKQNALTEKLTEAIGALVEG